MDANQTLKILIADDSASDRLILESIVKQAGHTPIGVENGALAIDAFKDVQPDIILLDVTMPVMGGLEAGKLLRELIGTDVIPILYLTSFTDQQTLVECLEAGGDDFISKPYNPVVLRSKIKSFGRLRKMHQTVAQQKAELEKHHSHLLQEQTVAKQVFDNIAHDGCLELDLIRHFMSPMAVFNGDVLVAEVGPEGNMVVLLGDFTGHGLPAAIGSLPLATTFYGMARKGFSIVDILRVINQKLHETLPIGFFCCAICLDISFKKRRVRIWNGGLPEAYLYRKSKHDYEHLPSKNLPLGVLSSRDFRAESVRLELEEGDRFYMWSDGILEARNPEGQMYGDARLDRLMQGEKGKDTLFDSLLSDVDRHVGDGKRGDDISLVQIEMADIDLSSYSEENLESTLRGNLADWKMSFTIECSSLRAFDPLPVILNIIDEVPGLRQSRAHLYTILSELYSNALEHGVLGLDSKLKSQHDGFTQYYDLRAKKLKALTDGQVEFIISHKVHQEGGALSIAVIDSGDGFNQDLALGQADCAVNTDYYGRGLTLLSSLCQSIDIPPPGNKITVVYEWVKEL